ncbi:MAG: prepilin-type N-terminal cleavage/methylation domain-containing protein [Gammaproteobacteria bacterium]|nr:prepilin-type N-terminal cleavage/methylation domain-containing protein [Gammaproteobacteria bacterium]
MKRTSGFTLIELMITVAIVGIIAAIAYPSYQNQVKKARRSEAQQLLLGASNKEEQYILEMRAYTNSFGDMNYGSEGWECGSPPTECSNDYYDITITVAAGPPPGYTITAVPKGTQAGDGNLSINSAGTKTGTWQ